MTCPSCSTCSSNDGPNVSAISSTNTNRLVDSRGIRSRVNMTSVMIVSNRTATAWALGKSGKLISAFDIARALALGADWANSARGFMFALGCIQALKCNRNTCPTGITTHDRRLQKGLVVEEKDARVAAYATAIIKEVEMIAHSVGVTVIGPHYMDARTVNRVHRNIGKLRFTIPRAV